MVGINESILSYEMNKKDINEEWKKQSEAQKREIEELRAQLAACTEAAKAAIEWIDAVPSDTALPAMPGFDRDWFDCVVNSANETTKATAEVLRCAEEETKMHKVGVDASGEISEVECDCKLCNAVRAAKEARGESI